MMERKEEREKRGSRAVCKIGRLFSSVFMLVGVRGRKEVGAAVQKRWAGRQQNC